ncbi:MAG: site-specific integrase [Bacteroidales bacterium]|nr:site-specific integrase [Candidatus Colimorpha pelethequi]
MIVNFICRASKAGVRDGLSPLELSVTIEGKRRYITLDRRANANKFNAKKQSFRGDKSLNEYLEAIKAKCYDVETAMLKAKMLFNVDTFCFAFRNGMIENDISIFGLFDEYISRQKSKEEKGLITRAVYVKYKCTIRYCKEALKSDKPLRDFTTIDTENIYLYMLEKMANNSAICYMRKLKTILFFAISEGYITKNPITYHFHKNKVETQPLTLEEIRTIRNKEFMFERLNNVRDLFVFQCYTGLAFIDMSTLTREDIKVEADGKEWIVKERMKTGVPSFIPLMDVAKEILVKYDYVLPVLSNQKYNSYLKEIQDICHITKNLHSHLARHTCGTLLLNAGVDILTVSKILVHSTSKVTESVYVKVHPETIRNNQF